MAVSVEYEAGRDMTSRLAISSGCFPLDERHDTGVLEVGEVNSKRPAAGEVSIRAAAAFSRSSRPPSTRQLHEVVIGIARARA